MKKPPKARPNPSKTRPPSPGSVLAAAQGHAAAGRFREAITAFKELLRLDDRRDLRVALADAYAGRARELAAKGMLKEALTVWENRVQVAPELGPDPAYFALLLRLGRVDSVAEAAVAGADGMDPALLATLRGQLAAFHLAGDPAVAAGLPADDPILTQGEAASRALDAYCGGDDEALRTALAAISFRSPYRDLAQILKALLRLPAAPAEAASMLARVPDDSGFAPLRRACELALGAPQALPERMAGVPEPAARFALTLAGWGTERQAVLIDYRRLGESGPKSLLRLLHRHRASLGEAWARRQALRLLVPGFPKSAGWMTETGWRRLSEEERLLVAAWRAEDSPNPWAEIEAWEDYGDYLEAQGTGEPGSDPALRLALVLRRVDNHRDTLAESAPSRVQDASDRVLADSLTRSLKYDPDHRETYERLARYYLGGKDLKSARAVLDLGLKRFPEDARLLTAALDLALAADAFKKATRYAREILRIDPIDTGARERLVKAHLAHAGKQMRAKRLDLAAKELEQAAEWDQGGRFKERRELLGGLMELAASPAKGKAILGERLRGLGVGIAAAFALAREAAAAGFSPAGVLKVAGMNKVPIPIQADLLTFLARLRAHLDGGEGLTPELRRLFEPPLKAAARWPIPRPELEGACETLSRAGLDEARRAFAEAALKRWPGSPIFELHRFESSYGEGKRRYPSPGELDRLDAAWGRARELGDNRSAYRLGEILRRNSPFGFLPDPAEIFDLEDDEDDGPLPGPGGSELDPLEIFREMIEGMGTDQILKIAGVGAADRRRFKELEREFGRGAVIDAILKLVREQVPGLPPNPRNPGSGPGGRSGPGPAPGAPPRPSPKGPGPARPKAGGPAKGPDNSDAAEPPPEQLDLFP